MIIKIIKCRYLMFLILLFVNCSYPILTIPKMLNKSTDIKVLILPFKDLTGQYQKEYELEKYLTKELNVEFKGLLLNPRSLLKTNTEGPRYKKIPNPYVFKFAENEIINDNNDLSYLVEKYSPDFIITGKIEVLDYTNIFAGTWTKYGSIGDFIRANEDSNLFFGVIGIRCEIFNAHTKNLMNQTFSIGVSEKELPIKLSREDAIKKAIRNIDDSLLEYFSISEYEKD